MHRSSSVYCPAIEEIGARLQAYRPRKPQETPFYRIVEDWLETAIARAGDPLDSSSIPMPGYVEDAFRRYLECGLPGHGLALLACPSCGRQVVLPFSCHERCPCPSCSAMRAARIGTRLIEEVIPRVPMRMWVLTLPRRLRFFLDKDEKVLDGTCRILASQVKRFIRKISGEPKGTPGTLQFIQWGSSHGLGRHVHIHQLSTDGLFVLRDDGTVVFKEVREPSDEEVRAVESRIARRVLDLFVRRGHLDKADAQEMKEWQFTGFSLHGKRAVEAEDRASLERLVRYCARPDFVASNVTYLPEKELVIYRTPKPTPEGATELEMHPLDFLRSVAGLIPPPGKNLLKYFGAFAPNFLHRRKVVLSSPQYQLPLIPSEEKKTLRRRSLYLTWAALLCRTFGLDPLRCECGDRMKIVQIIADPDKCFEYLDSLGLPCPTSAPNPPRSPPSPDDCTDPFPPDECCFMDPMPIEE